MTYQELRQELNKQYVISDIKTWWEFRKDYLKRLKFDEYKKLKNLAELLIECDNYCV